MNLFRRLLSLAFNHTHSTALACGCAANVLAEPIGAGEWFKLSPYFEGDYWTKEGQGWKRYRQVVTREHGNRLVTAFNALRDKQGERFRGLPIYRGHPDVDASRWPDESRLGGVMALEAREDGIYAQVAWNDEGERNRQQGYLVYPSPTWPYDVRAAAATNRIEPIELRSIGMTNSPRIDGVPAWTNADESPNPPGDEPGTTTNTPMPSWLLELLGLPADATEEQIKSAITSLKESAASAQNAMEAEKQRATDASTERDDAKRERDTAVNARTAAEADAAKFRALAINATITGAINSGRITAAEQAGFEQKLAANFDEAAAEIAAKQPALNTQPLTLTKRTDDLSTPAGRKLAYNAMLDEFMRPVAQGGKGLGFDEANAAIAADPNGAALIKAMNDASQAASAQS